MTSYGWIWSPYHLAMRFTLESEQEEDGRWIVEIPELSGVLAYGDTREAAVAKAKILALRVVADQLEQVKPRPT
jgi:predicted RNase H-like HicB family nuclease